MKFHLTINETVQNVLVYNITCHNDMISMCMCCGNFVNDIMFKDNNSIVTGLDPVQI